MKRIQYGSKLPSTSNEKESYLHPFVFKPREQESVGMMKNLSWGEYQVGEKVVCGSQKE